jgi:ABC-type phosphate transport system substrate-binding protein
MPSFKRLRSLLLVVVTGVVVVGPSRPSPARAAGNGLVLVVGKANPISNVTKAELNRLFSADPIKIDGQSVVPFALAPSLAERRAFDQVVLGMSPEEVNKFWIDRRIRGQGNPPKSAPSPEVIAKVVANFPGAMGYVPATSLTSALKPVAIDGKTYLETGYLLAQAH